MGKCVMAVPRPLTPLGSYKAIHGLGSDGAAICRRTQASTADLRRALAVNRKILAQVKDF